jgi:UDP-N-acetylmuramate dehydrogenase
LSPWHVVTEARLTVREPGHHDCASEINSVVAWRREHQPGGRNAGSVFVNPAPGEGSSGALIDKCGLRGFSVGGANVSEKHANFVQAAPGATALDVITLMTNVRDRVESETGTRLTSEVRLVGFPTAVVNSFAAPPRDSDRVAALCVHMGETP